MAISRQRVSYSSLSNVERDDKKVQYEDDYVDSEWSVAEDNSRLCGSPSLKQGALYPYLPGPEDFIDGGYDSSEERPNSLHRNKLPDVNLKNVMAGIFAIITGQNKGVPTVDQFPSSVSFLGSGKNGDTVLNSSVYIPSAPPVFEASGFDYSSYKEILEAEPPEWLPDSYTMACMQCCAPFTAITCGRHHCRFCGGVFCRVCTKGRCLLPVKFRERNPQRVCDACYDRLDPLQAVLINSISNAVQVAKHDVLDWTCTRGWLNLPVGLSMEHEIYKASITLRSYSQVSRLNPERSIPSAVLKGAKGLAILTVAKIGAVVAYKMGTGLVVARRMDGTWSAPSAIASVGLGWGAQIGGELTDFIIVLHNSKAVKTFCSRVHFSLGAGCSAAAGPVGRVLEADLRAGDRGSGLCYSYSCSKGAFVGVSLEGNVVTTRLDTNLRFYGDPYLTPTDILLGTVDRPRAAQPLYEALHDLYSKIQQ
ncbi:hypothetical protein RND81_07G075700 [Saponaria officinalis]|uniref:FYVE-type domain-containing protein n=1 Tax=Saponaria officinalis TaxID=3572 RepID=A0AAW1JN67_SAPOF